MSLDFYDGIIMASAYILYMLAFCFNISNDFEAFFGNQSARNQHK